MYVSVLSSFCAMCQKSTSLEKYGLILDHDHHLASS